MSEIIEKVETFIQRLHEMDYIIAPKASELVYETPLLEKNTLAEFLATRLYDYEKNRENIDEIRLPCARACLVWINRAFAHGVVQEGQGLARKLKEYQEKNDQLQRDNEKLSSELLRLQAEYEEFTSRFTLPEEND